jgi:hypothetical protein
LLAAFDHVLPGTRDGGHERIVRERIAGEKCYRWP